MNDNGPLLHPQRQMMNTRSKRQNPDAPIQPKLKKLRSDVSVKWLHGVLDSNEEKLSFLSTLLCLLSKGTWFRIVEEDDKKQSIYHNLGVDSSLLYPWLHDVGLIDEKDDGIIVKSIFLTLELLQLMTH
jgi:hypothetical protein